MQALMATLRHQKTNLVFTLAFIVISSYCIYVYIDLQTSVPLLRFSSDELIHFGNISQAKTGAVPSPSTALPKPGFNVAGKGYLRNLIDYSPAIERNDSTNSKRPCPETPPALVGSIEVNQTVLSVGDLEGMFSHLKPGGHWRPEHCYPRHKVALIVPYRNRAQHLRIFLHHMHQFLRRQELDYRIYIIEQVAHTSFNRGKLLNVGCEMAERLHGHSCFVLHDVDLLPENDLNLYTCDQFPKHMSSCIDKMKYRLPYETIFGGVSAMRAEHFKHINGFSNIFWGWGGEDDDVSTSPSAPRNDTLAAPDVTPQLSQYFTLRLAIRFSGLPIIHANCSVARYTSLNHKQEQPNAKRFKLIRRTMFRIKKDGLNTLSYRVVDLVLTRLYTHVIVDLLQRK